MDTQEPKKLISLDEHDMIQKNIYRITHDPKPRPNGIACPNCGHELVDDHPLEGWTAGYSYKSIKCHNCGFTGKRIA